MNWKQHRKKWKGCQKCQLCEKRRNVVLLKGKIPCDVLFIGEAPGKSEDVLGRPFVGPAGKLMDYIVEKALGEEWSRAFTNIIACIPLDEDGKKVSIGKDIPKESVSQCSTRVDEIVKICKPSVIVWVGSFAAKHGPRVEFEDIAQVEITHPAAIIRANPANRSLPIQRCIVTISDAINEGEL